MPARQRAQANLQTAFPLSPQPALTEHPLCKHPAGKLAFPEFQPALQRLQQAKRAAAATAQRATAQRRSAFVAPPAEEAQPDDGDNDYDGGDGALDELSPPHKPWHHLCAYVDPGNRDEASILLVQGSPAVARHRTRTDFPCP